MNDGLLLEAAIETDISKYVPSDDKWETKLIIWLRDYPSKEKVLWEMIPRYNWLAAQSGGGWDRVYREHLARRNSINQWGYAGESWEPALSLGIFQQMDTELYNNVYGSGSQNSYSAFFARPEVIKTAERYYGGYHDQFKTYIGGKTTEDMEKMGEMRRLLSLVWMLRYVGFTALGDSLEGLFPIIQKYRYPLPPPKLNWKFGNWLENVKEYTVYFRFNELQKVFRKAIDALLEVCNSVSADDLMEMKYTEEQAAKYIG